MPPELDDAAVVAAAAQARRAGARRDAVPDLRPGPGGLISGYAALGQRAVVEGVGECSPAPSRSADRAGDGDRRAELTPQILQLNGNPNDVRGGGATCFGDSGGPVFLNGYLVAVTSYVYPDNCRYLSGYQRVDIPVVQDWLGTVL